MLYSTRRDQQRMRQRKARRELDRIISAYAAIGAVHRDNVTMQIPEPRVTKQYPIHRDHKPR